MLTLAPLALLLEGPHRQEQSGGSETLSESAASRQTWLLIGTIVWKSGACGSGPGAAVKRRRNICSGVGGSIWRIPCRCWCKTTAAPARFTGPTPVPLEPKPGQNTGCSSTGPLRSSVPDSPALTSSATLPGSWVHFSLPDGSRTLGQHLVSGKHLFFPTLSIVWFCCVHSLDGVRRSLRRTRPDSGLGRT